jgi:hypothetical protein
MRKTTPPWDDVIREFSNDDGDGKKERIVQGNLSGQLGYQRITSKTI